MKSFDKKRIIFSVFSISLFFGIDVYGITIDFVGNRAPFIAYLKSLGRQLSFPWPIINTGARAKGFTQQEIDAIPVGIPFLYEEKYKLIISEYDNASFQEDVDCLIELFTKEVSGIASQRKKEEILHRIIHGYVLRALKLPSNMSTKELARLVESKKINVHLLCKVQLPAFFVKYLLESGHI